jgi:proteasome lid subunit RPN8/RPN11
LSDDEIVFGDVTYREPRRALRPDLDRKWACIAYELPGPDDLPIFLDHQTADAIERHALRDTGVELGGILLGQECLDEQSGRPFVWVTQALEAKHYENTQASFTYTHDSWEEITRERDRLHPDLDIVGWYHTHPDFGIFLSGHDQFLHGHFFGQPLQVAYVIDPIRQTRGFFQWRDGRLEQVGGYYLTAERRDRLALARFVNDLENVPNPGGGGGLSPRLEAELIAMLTRQSHPAASHADRAQTAAVFSLIGVIVGVLGLAAVLGLSSLGRQVQDQSEALKALATGLEKAQAGRDLDVDSARVRAKEVALDSLLREVHAGSSPERFTTLYSDAVRERDEARLELKKQKVGADSIFQANQSLESKLAAANKKTAELELDVQKLTPLRATVEDLRERLRERDGSTDEPSLRKKYNYAWYVAATAVATCLLLALGLVAAVFRQPPAEVAPDEPPHEIAS